MTSAARPPTPILVTGAPRSGSTWVGNILALEHGSGYIHEPFNKNCRNGICRIRFPHAFSYITARTEAPYVAALADTLSWKYSAAEEVRALRTPRDALRMTRDLAYFEAMRRRSARIILKDPLALFSADWLAARFGMQVVIVIRHPAAFVASLRAANWHRFRFRIFADQSDLMADRLAPFRDEIEAAIATQPDAFDTGVLLWRIFHHHIHLLRQEHPAWIFVRHEDISRDPAGAFRDLYEKLGLCFTDQVRRSLERHSNEQNPLNKLSIFGHKRNTVRNSADNIFSFKKRLTPAEIERIRTAAAPLSNVFYSDADW